MVGRPLPVAGHEAAALREPVDEGSPTLRWRQAARCNCSSSGWSRQDDRRDLAVGGWVARVGKENSNEQLGPWGPRTGEGGRPRAFPTAAACLGDAVAALVAMVDREAGGPS